MDICRSTVANAFGGTSDAALKANQWIPSGPAVPLSSTNENGTVVQFLHGDCWYQRYDCLKTYPFTQEDENSIVEIGSFMVETRVNIDGRYDRNRGLLSNLNITPQNFNLLNTIYSQKDNFFNYRMLDDDFYKLNNFPNTITWSKEKMTSEEAEEKAKQASIDNPDDIYYVAYDDIMDPASDIRWIAGEPYNYSRVQIKNGKPFIKGVTENLGKSTKNTRRQR